MTTDIPSAAIARFHKQLQKWYEANGRKTLPWRNTKNAYKIYISETMLQQTQVKTVLERFYHPFLTRFPDIQSLANANEKEVLAAWQGLGYYSRARNLHKAAKIMVGEQASGFGLLENSTSPNPQSLIPLLLALPGIGKNTAHAVAAFGFHLQVPVLEANVKRVMARIFALKTPSDAQLWQRAEQLLNKKDPFDYNQAMMDIGSMVCTKRAPDCPVCPANAICQGQKSPESYPTPKIKKTMPVRRKNIFVLRNSKGQYYAAPRETRFLGGLYHFVEEDSGHKARGEFIGHVRQVYSHFILEADVYLVEATGSRKNWYSFKKLAALPFSMVEQKILALLGTNVDDNG